MTALATPAQVQPGHVVRIRLGGHVYSSPVMPAFQARAEFERVTRELEEIGGSFRALPFTCADGRDVLIRGRSVSAVEVGPPPVRQERPVPPSDPAVVHVHFHADGSHLEAEPAAAPVGRPTPLALGGGRSPRRSR